MVTEVNLECLLVQGLFSLDLYCEARGCEAQKEQIRDILRRSIPEDENEANKAQEEKETEIKGLLS